MVVAEVWREVSREENMVNYCLMSIEFQFYKMKSIMGIYGDDGCTTMECI